MFKKYHILDKAVNEMQYPKRKQVRLKNYDYAQEGYYFITICCNEREKYLGNITAYEGEPVYYPEIDNPFIELSGIGKIVFEQWFELKKRYPSIDMDQFVIMPNHIHGIIIIEDLQIGEKTSPAIGDIICAFKSITTRLVNKEYNIPNRIFWQRGYYEHIIRNEKDLSNTRKYIIENPLKWQEDKYYR